MMDGSRSTILYIIVERIIYSKSGSGRWPGDGGRAGKVIRAWANTCVVSFFFASAAHRVRMRGAYLPTATPQPYVSVAWILRSLRTRKKRRDP